MTTVLSLGTYPVRRPIHGGQRRVTAFGAFYAAHGLRFETASVYDGGAYTSGAVDPHDIATGAGLAAWDGVPFVGDLQAGEIAATSPKHQSHFRRVLQTVAPAAVQLDHPFLWPLVKAWRTEGVISPDLPIIYSSHNWEGPLKTRLLLDSGVIPSRAREAGAVIEALEREVLAHASVVICVSEADAAVYRGLTDKPVCVVPNGVSRPSGTAHSDAVILREFADRPLFLFVGSAYPPNIDGFTRLVSEGGFFFTPPRKHFAVCGGASAGIFRAPPYHRYLHSNSERVTFFPEVGDEDLFELRSAAHAMLLPIVTGGGSNLKTAEALVTGCRVVATSTAMRGFERFAGAAGLRIADTREAFHRGMVEAYKAPRLVITEQEREAREALYWDRCFADSDFGAHLSSLPGLNG